MIRAIDHLCFPQVTILQNHSASIVYIRRTCKFYFPGNDILLTVYKQAHPLRNILILQNEKLFNIQGMTPFFYLNIFIAIYCIFVIKSCPVSFVSVFFSLQLVLFFLLFSLIIDRFVLYRRIAYGGQVHRVIGHVVIH